MASAGSGGRGKNKMVAALLAFFLGYIGAQHFYLGSTTVGIIALLTCGGCGFLSLIDTVMLLMMSDEDFDAKYNARSPEGMEFVWAKA